MGNIQCAEISEIRSIDRPDGHKGRPCKWIGAAHVIYGSSDISSDTMI